MHDKDKHYTFKSDEIRKNYECLQNIDHLSTRVFVETVEEWCAKTEGILVKESYDDADMKKILDVIAPSLTNFENFYPIPVGIHNMRMSCTSDSDYQSRLVRKNFNSKGYTGIVVVDDMQSNQKIKVKMPYGNFFSSSEEVIIDMAKVKGADLHAGDVILYPKYLTVFYPRGYDDKKLRFFEFDIVGHD